ncbi:MAG: hypothetical protein ACREFA_14140 [Stellaceae bacterium]
MAPIGERSPGTPLCEAAKSRAWAAAMEDAPTERDRGGCGQPQVIVVADEDFSRSWIVNQPSRKPVAASLAPDVFSRFQTGGCREFSDPAFATGQV